MVKRYQSNKLLRDVRSKHNTDRTTRSYKLIVRRSNKYMYVQLLDIKTGMTVAGAKGDDPKTLGAQIAALAVAKKITEVVFDRGSGTYHGRIKQLAESAREGGLKF